MSGYLDLSSKIQLLRHNSHISSAHLQLVTTILNSTDKNLFESLQKVLLECTTQEYSGKRW